MRIHNVNVTKIAAFSLPIYMAALPAIACIFEPIGFRPPEDQRVGGWVYGNEERPPNRNDVKFSYYAYILRDENAVDEKYFIEHVFCNMHDTQRISFQWAPIDYAYNRFPPARCDCNRSSVSYPLNRIEVATPSHIQFLNTSSENSEPAHAIQVTEQGGSQLATLFRTVINVWTELDGDAVRQEVAIESRWRDGNISLSLKGDVDGLEFTFGPATNLIRDSEPAKVAISEGVTTGLLTETNLASYSDDLDFAPVSLLKTDSLVFSPEGDGTLFSYNSSEAVAQYITLSVLRRETRDFILSRRIQVHAPPAR